MGDFLIWGRVWVSFQVDWSGDGRLADEGCETESVSVCRVIGVGMGAMGD